MGNNKTYHDPSLNHESSIGKLLAIAALERYQVPDSLLSLSPSMSSSPSPSESPSSSLPALRRLSSSSNLTSNHNQVQNLLAGLALKGITVTEWGAVLYSRLDVPVSLGVSFHELYPWEKEIC